MKQHHPRKPILRFPGLLILFGLMLGIGLAGLSPVRAAPLASEDGRGPLTKAAYLLASGQGQQLLDAGRPQEAEPLFRGLLARMDEGMAYEGLEAGYHRAVTLFRLGRSLRFQGKFDAAAREYRQTLAALGELDPANRGVRGQTAVTHTDLADVLRGAGRYAEAQAWADKAVQGWEDIGDPSLPIWNTYRTLAHIADARAEESEAAGDTAKAGEQRAAARGWRKKERAAYAAFPGHWANMTSRWEPIVQAIRAGVAGDAALQSAVGRVLDGLAQTEEGARLGRAIRAIFAGARDADSLAEEHGLDGEGYLILHKILE